MVQVQPFFSPTLHSLLGEEKLAWLTEWESFALLSHPGPARSLDTGPWVRPAFKLGSGYGLAVPISQP